VRLRVLVRLRLAMSLPFLILRLSEGFGSRAYVADASAKPSDLVALVLRLHRANGHLPACSAALSHLRLIFRCLCCLHCDSGGVIGDVSE
jgi:hypothetical protein